jgi:hypothetical protein
VRAIAPRLVFVGRSTATGLFLKLEVGEHVAVVIADHEAGAGRSLENG